MISANRINHTRTYGNKAYTLLTLVANAYLINYTVSCFDNAKTMIVRNRDIKAATHHPRYSYKSSFFQKKFTNSGQTVNGFDDEVIMLSINGRDAMSNEAIIYFLEDILDDVRLVFNEDDRLIFHSKNNSRYKFYDIVYKNMHRTDKDLITIRDIERLIEELKNPTFDNRIDDPFMITRRETLTKSFINDTLNKSMANYRYLNRLIFDQNQESVIAYAYQRCGDLKRNIRELITNEIKIVTPWIRGDRDGLSEYLKDMDKVYEDINSFLNSQALNCHVEVANEIKNDRDMVDPCILSLLKTRSIYQEIM